MNNQEPLMGNFPHAKYPKMLPLLVHVDSVRILFQYEDQHFQLPEIIHSPKTLFLGIKQIRQSAQVPNYYSLGIRDHFLISGDIHSQARQAIEALFLKRIQNGLGFIFVDTRTERGYLQMIKSLFSKSDCQDELIVLDDFDFDIVEAINSNKRIALQIDDIHNRLDELNAFLLCLHSAIMDKDKAVMPTSHVPVFFHGLENIQAINLVRLHEVLSCNSVQLNLFYFSEAPHLLHESILANIAHAMFFQSEFNSQIIESSYFVNNWNGQFSSQLQGLSDAEVLFIKNTEIHKFNYTPDPLKPIFI